MVNKGSALLEGDPCFIRTIDSGQWELRKKSVVIEKRPASLRTVNLREFTQGQHTEAVVQRDRGCVLGWYLNLVRCKGFLDGAGIKGSWKAAESWHCTKSLVKM